MLWGMSPAWVALNIVCYQSKSGSHSKAQNPQLLPRRCSVGCPLLQVCVHLDERVIYPWLYQYGSRRPNRDRGRSPENGCFTQMWWRKSGECYARLRWSSLLLRMSPLVLSSSYSSIGAGCYGTDMAEASSVRFSPDRFAPGSSSESAPGRGQSTSGSTVLAGPSMVLGPDLSPWWLSMGDSHQEDLLSQNEVVETILQSRVPSMRKLYALEWRLLTSWCGDRQLNPVNCPIGTVLEFLQALLSTGLTHSILKVYVAAISAYYACLVG